MSGFTRFRRGLALLCCCCLWGAFARAEAVQAPTNEIFSVGYHRLGEALAAGDAIAFSLAAQPESLAGYENQQMAALSALIGAMTIEGSFAAQGGDGHLRAALQVGDQPLLSLEQAAEGDRVGMKIDDLTFSSDRAMHWQNSTMLALPEALRALLGLDYTLLIPTEPPFLSALSRQGQRLWDLAAPYSAENPGLRLDSAPAPRGVTYTIDTETARLLLTDWAAGFTRDGLELGLDEEAFDELIEKINALAAEIELAEPMTFDLVYDENGRLREAEGEGILLENGRRTPIDYRYTCDVRSWRITQKHTLHFEPQNGDTLVINATSLINSNGEGSAREETNLTASGRYNGQAYRISLQSESTNAYKSRSGEITETLKGTTTLTLRYAGETLLDCAIRRRGEALSGATDTQITETYTVTALGAAKAPLYEGTVTFELGYDPANQPQQALTTETSVDWMDFANVQALRSAIAETMATLPRRFLDALPPEAMQALQSAY
ncbi:MAG: hypothetical protein LBN04_04925 [Oscillospiraceae bacterium]|jgi:hypothetical protein|nr:hypothetical protein [Oscillospiraceae bacterium]